MADSACHIDSALNWRQRFHGRKACITYRDHVNHDTFADCITPRDQTCEMDVGAKLKRLRKDAGLSQAALQALCGWGPGNSRIANYETNGREPSLADLGIILTKLGTSTEDFFSGAHTRVRENHCPSYGAAADEERLLDLYRSSSQRGRRAILEIAQSLSRLFHATVDTDDDRLE